MASKKTETVTIADKSEKNHKGSAAANGAVGLAPATVAPGIDAKDSVYEVVAKDLAAVGASDAQAKKISGSPLGETRGNDVLRLHAGLRASDLLNGKLNRVFASLQTALADLDSHLHIDASALSTQSERQTASLLKSLEAAQRALDEAVSSSQSTLTSAVSKAQAALGDQVSKAYTGLAKTTEKAQASLSEQVADGVTDLQKRNDALLATVKDSFTKLAKATAGSEENLKAQTNSFSTAVEELLANVQTSLQKQIFEFREETTRQVDKRMNQADVAFAAVRADQEVIKALLTDIIKDRMGRAEPKYR